jgi:hypothetical protein
MVAVIGLWEHAPLLGSVNLALPLQLVSIRDSQRETTSPHAARNASA